MFALLNNARQRKRPLTICKGHIGFEAKRILHVCNVNNYLNRFMNAWSTSVDFAGVWTHTLHKSIRVIHVAVRESNFGIVLFYALQENRSTLLLFISANGLCQRTHLHGAGYAQTCHSHISICSFGRNHNVWRHKKGMLYREIVH